MRSLELYVSVITARAQAQPPHRRYIIPVSYRPWVCVVGSHQYWPLRCLRGGHSTGEVVASQDFEIPLLSGTARSGATREEHAECTRPCETAV